MLFTEFESDYWIYFLSLYTGLIFKMETMREVTENVPQTIDDEQKMIRTDFEQAVLKSFFNILEKGHYCFGR